MTQFVLLAALLFVSTNLDDLFILLTFFSDPTHNPRNVFLGQLLGIGGLYAVSVACALAAYSVQPKYMGLLGLAPICIGTIKLLKRIPGRQQDNPSPEHLTSSSSASQVALVTFGNGGDNLTVYVPVFSAHSKTEISIFGFVFFALTLVWIAVAYLLTRHPRLGPSLRRAENLSSPLVLIALGILILKKSGALQIILATLSPAG